MIQKRSGPVTGSEPRDVIDTSVGDSVGVPVPV